MTRLLKKRHQQVREREYPGFIEFLTDFKSMTCRLTNPRSGGIGILLALLKTHVVSGHLESITMAGDGERP